MKRKEITAYTLMTVLLLLSGFILFRMDQSRLQQKKQAENRIRLDSVAEMIQYMEGIRESAKVSYEAHLEDYLHFKAGYPDDHAAEDEYSEQLPAGNGWEEQYSYLKSDAFLEWHIRFLSATKPSAKRSLPTHSTGFLSFTGRLLFAL